MAKGPVASALPQSSELTISPGKVFFLFYRYHGNEKGGKNVAKQQRKAQDEAALAVRQKLRSKQGAGEMRRIPVNCEIKAIC